jgi:hypothetical protein
MILVYRKHKDDLEWHFHTQCSRWPESDFLQVRIVNMAEGERLCRECARREAAMFPRKKS